MPGSLPPPPGEKPVWEITNPITGEGLRVYSNGMWTGRQPPDAEPACLINRMQAVKHTAYDQGFEAGRKAGPLLRATGNR